MSVFTHETVFDSDSESSTFDMDMEQRSSLSPESAHCALIDTPGAMSDLVDILAAQPTDPPSLYIDLEGVNLSRHGTISILQVYILSLSQTYLIDIHILGEKAFTTPSATTGLTFKALLESEVIPKVFFDVRNDSDALHAHFGIRLAGIQDLQLMELSSRAEGRKFVWGLAKCIDRHAGLSRAERRAWKATKETGLDLFSPERGGNYEVFNQRPLSEEIRRYCAQDVQFLPRLWKCYDRVLDEAERARLCKAARDRVTLSQSPGFNGKGRHMALAPPGWADWSYLEDDL